MKVIYVLILQLLLVSLITSLRAQNLTAATNEIHLNLSEGLKEATQLPVIKWINPRIEHTVSQEKSIQIEVQVSSFYPIVELVLNLADPISKTNYGQKKITIPQQAKDFAIKETIRLPDGSIYMELIAATADSVKVSSGRSVLVGEDLISNAVLLNRKDKALIFATDKYDHWDDLVNPVHDAHSIATELQNRYGFETEIVENPTVEEVWEKIRSYNEQKFNPQDQLLIFFAGHGQFDEAFGEGYVVAKNSLASDKSKTTYLSHNRLRGVINNIPCEHILLLMDVCFGGTFDPVLARSRSTVALEATQEELIVRKLSHKTRKYLTSGGKEYVSDGKAGGHSPFASKLIESLKTQGGEDRILTLTELQSNLEKLKQLPRFGSFGEDEALSDFIFISK